MDASQHNLAEVAPSISQSLAILMSYGVNMAAPQRRPRDKGGTDHRDSAAKSFESSNQTMAMFLGATPKSWMTGHYPTKEMPSSLTHTHTHPHPKQTRQTTNSQTRANGSRPQTADEGWAATSRQDSVTIATPGSMTSSTPLVAATTPTSLNLTEKNAHEHISTVLPSPAPSDELRQASVHIIDLEEEEREQTAIQHTRSISTEALGEPATIEPAASLGDIEERENRVLNAEPQNGLSDSANNVGILRAPEVAAGLMNEWPTEQHGALSRNDDRPDLLVPSPIPSQSAPPALTNRGPDLLQRLPVQIPSNADVVAFRRQIVLRIEAIRSAGQLGREIEISRLGLLEDACLAYDISYIMVHQLYCLAVVPNSANSGVHGLAPEYKNGLVLLTPFLLQNSQLSKDAIAWFSTFPLPLNALLERWPSLKLTYEKVLECLLRLPRGWWSLSSLCHNRCYPPLVDEMICMISVNSTMLQQVIFNSVVRDIWVGPQDACFKEVEILFRQNQREVGLRGSINGALPANAEAIVLYNQAMGTKYHNLWVQHCAHLNAVVQPGLVSQQGSLSNVVMPMSPAHQVSTGLTNPTNATAYHNISQSVNPASASRRPASLVIDTQNILTNPTYFVTTPSVSSSPFSSVSVPTNPTTAVARFPFSQSAPPSGLIRPNASIPQSQQRPPRRDFAIPAVPHTSSSRRMTGNRNSMHRPQNSTSPQIAANPPLQPFFGRRREPPSVYTVPSHSHAASPVTARFGQIGIPFPNGQNISQPSGPYNPPQIYGQYRSASNPSTPYHTRHTQVLTQQAPIVPNFAPISPSPTWPLFPPSGHVRSFRDPPNAVPATLHQVHVRSPNLTSVDTDGNSDKASYFAFVKTVAVMPERLTKGHRHFRWIFDVDRDHFQLLAMCSSGKGGGPPTRIFHAGSRIIRLRCVRLSDLQGMCESDWVLAETHWPNGIAILLNGIALEFRKKALHGKDLPVDITKHIREGANIFAVAITRSNESNAVTYALGIEFVEITDSKNIHATIPKLEAKDALKRIAERSASFDPDIEIVNNTITIDLTDPFTSCMWEVPVRGKNCRHNQCFDLNVFLQTRGSKTSNLSAPEQFKCPICGSDARPQTLTIDMFFVKIREELQQTGRLDAKSVILDGQGSWTIKEEDKKGEPGDGNGGPILPGRQHSEIPGGRPLAEQENEIIELDDD